jgi:hypothetical protein
MRSEAQAAQGRVECLRFALQLSNQFELADSFFFASVRT